MNSPAISVYLIEYFTTAIYKVFTVGRPPLVRLTGLAIMVAVTLGLSWVSYQIVEVRLTRALKRCLRVPS